jgi:hypothetical protein
MVKPVNFQITVQIAAQCYSVHTVQSKGSSTLAISYPTSTGMFMATVQPSRVRTLCSLCLALSMFSWLHRTNLKHDKFEMVTPECLSRLESHEHLARYPTSETRIL